MGKEYTTTQIRAALKEAGITSADRKNEDIKVNIAKSILEDPMYTRSSDIADALKRTLRIDERDASRVIDYLKRDRGSGLSLSQQFAAATTGIIDALTPPHPQPAIGTCADVRQAATGGGPVNQIAARYCDSLGMN